MRTDYMVFQRTSIDFTERSTEEIYTLNRLLRDQIFDLIKKHILEEGLIYNMNLEIDGDKTDFEGDEYIDENFQKALKSIKNAQAFTMVTSYYFKGSKTDFEDADPRAIANFLAQVDNRIIEAVQHSFYIKDEQGGSDDDSELYYYGSTGDELYKGQVELVMTDELPEVFDYRSLDTALVMDSFKVPQTSMVKVKHHLAELIKLSEYDTLSIEENEVNFFMNNARLRNKEEVDKFIYHTASLYQELQSYRDQEGVLGTMANFIDCSQGPPSKLRIDFDDEGNYGLNIATI